MRKICCLIGILFMSIGIATAQPQLNKDNIEEVIKAMTLEEKVNFVVGTTRLYVVPPSPAPGMIKRPRPDVEKIKQIVKERENTAVRPTDAVVAFSQGRVKGASGDVQPVKRLGITTMVLSDGPAGLRIDPTRPGDPNTYYCTAFPIGALLASSWDPQLVERVTTAMGQEVKEYGVDVVLAPAMNIERNPLCGRNFEYFSEDPLLSGKIGAAYIRGIQSNGVGVSMKHFAVNNQETYRNGVDVHLSMRALREIYLRGFEIAVKEGRPWTVMSSYNKINGVLASENRWLLHDVLRGEWGFDGFVMTDWWAEQNGARQIAAGNDMLMPGTQHQVDEIVNAVKSGEMDERYLDDAVRNILNILVKSPTFNRYDISNKPDLKGHALIGRQAAAESMVLLKNEGNTLPLAKGRVALYGIDSYDILVGGTGSGNVNRAYKISLNEGLSEQGYRLDKSVAAMYKAYIDAEKAKLPKDNFWTVPVIAEKAISTTEAAQAAKKNDIAVLTIGRMAGEGGDRKLEKGDWYLTDTEAGNLRVLCEAFHQAGKKVVVVMNMGGAIDMAGWNDEPDAILHSFMGGQEAGHAVADVLSGKVNPSGKLTFTIAKEYNDYCSATNFPSTDGVDGQVDYREGVLVGYRWFDTKKIAPLYPFGYGLSYTQFDYSNMTVTPVAEGYDVVVTVKNTGRRAGREVAELYVHAPGKATMRADQELKGFAKTKLLRPGQSETLHIAVKADDLRWFDDYENKWKLEPGCYELRIGASSKDVRTTKTVTLDSKE